MWPVVLALVALLPPALGRAQTCTWSGTPSLAMPTVTALRSDARLLASPARLAVDSEERRYVTDPPRGRMVVRDVRGRLVRVVEGLGRPLGVAVDGFGVAYVGDELTGSVLLFDSGGHFLRKLGQGDGEFALPNHIAVDPGTGVVYVADSGANEVKAFRDGMVVTRFGGTGSAAGQFSFPTGIHASAAGEIFVADQNNDRVQVFDREGTFLRCFGKGGGMSLKPRFGRVQGLTGDTSGRVYVADAFQGTVKVFDAAGVFLGAIGQFGDRTGELQLPQSLAVDSNNRLLVASTGNSRIEVFGLDAFSDPNVLDARVQFLGSNAWAKDRRGRRFPIWAVIDVPGHASTEIAATSVTANGVGSRGSRPRVDGRFWTSFDYPSVAATLPPEGGWVAVRGNLVDGSEFEANGWLGPAPQVSHPTPRKPSRRSGDRCVIAAGGVRP